MARSDAVQVTLQIVAECRRLVPNLLVTWEPGWETRGNGLSANYEFGSIHHTATNTSFANPFPTQRLLTVGRSDLRGPLANFAGPVCSAEVPRLHVVAAFPANHGGASRASGPIPALSLFNPRSMGMEIDYSGMLPMSDGQLLVGHALTQAIANVLANGNVEVVRAHHETSVTGKIDPSWGGGTKKYDMNDWRRQSAAIRPPTPAPPPESEEDDDMPQVISESVSAGQEAVINIAPSGGMKDDKFVPGGAAGFGQAFASFVGDAFEKPRVPIKARIGIMGEDGNYRPAFGTSFDTVLNPGRRFVVQLKAGDTALVVTARDYPVGVCVEYVKA